MKVNGRHSIRAKKKGNISSQKPICWCGGLGGDELGGSSLLHDILGYMVYTSWVISYLPAFRWKPGCIPSTASMQPYKRAVRTNNHLVELALNSP